MKIAIIGYGKMGNEIHRLAMEKKHEVALIIDKDDDISKHNFKGIDVAIEFSNPNEAIDNYFQLFEKNIPVVSGTTGWTDRYSEVAEFCKQKNGAFFYASNFSIGVNLFFEINKTLARFLNNFPEYDVEVTEVHHINKIDAPSGTAKTIAEEIIKIFNRKKNWTIDSSTLDNEKLVITSIREGDIFGTHITTFDSDIDSIELIHTAKSRRGFAQGAILAAEFLKGKTGIFTMADLLKLY